MNKVAQAAKEHRHHPEWTNVSASPTISTEDHLCGLAWWCVSSYLSIGLMARDRSITTFLSGGPLTTPKD